MISKEEVKVFSFYCVGKEFRIEKGIREGDERGLLVLVNLMSRDSRSNWVEKCWRMRRCGYSEMFEFKI